MSTLYGGEVTMRSTLPGSTKSVVNTFPLMIVRFPASKNGRAGMPGLTASGHGEHGAVHAHQPCVMFAGAADADPASHVGLAGKLGGQVSFPALRLERLEHRLRPAGTEAVETARAEQRRHDLRYPPVRSHRPVLGCRMHRETEAAETVQEEEILGGPRSQGRLDDRARFTQPSREEV